MITACDRKRQKEEGKAILCYGTVIECEPLKCRIDKAGQRKKEEK